MDSRNRDDDRIDGFGAWSETEIDEAVREVKSKMDEDFEEAAPRLADEDRN